MCIWSMDARMMHDRLKDFISLAGEAFESIALYAGSSTMIPVCRDTALWALQRGVDQQIAKIWMYTNTFNIRTFENIGLLVDHRRVFNIGRSAKLVLNAQAVNWKQLADSWAQYRMSAQWMLFLCRDAATRKPIPCPELARFFLPIGYLAEERNRLVEEPLCEIANVDALGWFPNPGWLPSFRHHINFPCQPYPKLTAAALDDNCRAHIMSYLSSLQCIRLSRFLAIPRIEVSLARAYSRNCNWDEFHKKCIRDVKSMPLKYKRDVGIIIHVMAAAGYARSRQLQYRSAGLHLLFLGSGSP